MDPKARYNVVVGGINDLLRYSAKAARAEVRRLIRAYPNLSGRVDVIPAVV